MEIKRSIDEQHEIMLQSFDPFDFIDKYIKLFEKQLECSTKVFLFQIPYSNIFVKEFDEKMEGEMQKMRLDTALFDKIEILIHRFQLERFHDQEFCHLCICIILKWIGVVVSRVCSEIEDDQFENVAILFKYCPFKIDLTKIMSSKIARELMNIPGMIDNLLETQRQIECINLGIGDDIKSILIEEISQNRTHNEKYFKALSQFKVPDAFFGRDRVVKYDIHQVLGMLFLI